ncbi:MD-2-related lipid-recognition protein-like [Contarinia nasturtii]|uniref:MD-2-related lipid-recognition protein-like n=1 Tax=Contarinia nasturtii TaxID=265458 RepID=UPI0012D48359|nr:MD-2-related lipid-recognition protein-like [Contarinia nasturtii]XP_031623702.1 MD-2-related lipid-recognition protein-like [Contarinia nasturtii]
MTTNKLFSISFFLCFACLVCISNAENVHFSAECKNSAQADCTVHEVRVVPCPESKQEKPCKLKRGTSASIEFDVTPQWNADTPFGHVYSVTAEGDLPMAGMDTNACNHTACPIQSGHRHTYRYTLPLAKKFPVGLYTIRWVLRKDEDDNTNEQCCFTTKIKLTK